MMKCVRRGVWWALEAMAGMELLVLIVVYILKL